MRRSMTRRILASSSMSCCLFWRRPAVSTSTASRPRDSAAATASKATAPGSAPGRCAMTGTPTCSPQIRSCSTAAARKVSAAASATLRPSATSRCASLAMVVVLPVPLTPTNRITDGGSPRSNAPDPTRTRRSRISVASARRASSPVRPPSLRNRARAASTSSSVASAPTSAPMSASSTSSQVASVAGAPAPRIERRRLPSPDGRARRPMPVGSRRGLATVIGAAGGGVASGGGGGSSRRRLNT